jgi:hypothetical protein
VSSNTANWCIQSCSLFPPLEGNIALNFVNDYKNESSCTVWLQSTKAAVPYDWTLKIKIATRDWFVCLSYISISCYFAIASKHFRVMRISSWPANCFTGNFKIQTVLDCNRRRREFSWTLRSPREINPYLGVRQPWATTVVFIPKASRASFRFEAHGNNFTGELW